ncbi:hypothetical protein [Epilithonimonas zeae]|uniref:hypothetical protein n=1 Tax=Epilithonimonas zeae TaxID=1416779 RepID=UPI00200C22BC|nr:hypothetical protein [Epilithonimonas zeae]UQB68321.1 hypothetical protein KI430_15045 [Epilithonimonas zeae]
MIIGAKNEIFEVNTSESYNKNIFIFKNNLIIPYINLEIFDIQFVHPKIKRYDKLDFSFLIFKDVLEIAWNYLVNDEEKQGQIIFDKLSLINEYLTEYIEATNIFTEYYGYNFEIKFKEQYLFFSEEIKVRNGGLNFWVPIADSSLRKNMDDEKVQSFFNKECIPKEILELVGVSDSGNISELVVL